MKKRWLVIILVFLVFLMPYNHPQGCAIETNTIPKLEEITLPMDFNFTVSDGCSGHTYFMQAAADETGCFAIYSRHLNPKNRNDINFKKAYIDIYQSDGTLLQELSFTTALDLAVQLEKDVVNIYFYNFVVIYNRTTEELLCYSIPNGAAVNNGLYKELRKEKFTVGDYTYSCTRGFDGYTKLLRNNGNCSEILVEMVGTFNSIWLVALPGGISGIIIVLTATWLYKKRKCNST